MTYAGTNQAWPYLREPRKSPLPATQWWQLEGPGYP